MRQTASEITSVENQINLFFHNHSLGKLLRQCGIGKENGISLEVLFQFLLALAFTGKNLFRHMEPAGSFDGIFKDAVYRSDGSSFVPILLSLLSSANEEESSGSDA